MAIPILQMEKLRPRQAKLFPKILVAFNWNSKNLSLDLLIHAPELPLPFPGLITEKGPETSLSQGSQLRCRSPAAQ